MIEKLILTSRVTEVDAVSIRMNGAYKRTTLSSDAHLVKIFSALEPESVLLTSAIRRLKDESVLEEKDEEGTLENATAIKKEVVAIINDKLVVYLRAMIQVDEATYGNFARTIAEIIADNNEVVKKRRKKPEPVE